VTVLVASGDDGASSPNARQNKTMCGYNPSYPATSQFVTAVGATSGPEYGEAEVACQSNKGGVITSGGGFSKRVPLPRWQEKAVSAYFGGLDNSSRPVPGYGYGRGVPDVSVVGHNFQVLIGGSYFEISG
jgi:tripeptidyl-peptidase-1